MSTQPPLPKEGSGIWYTLWTAAKLFVVLVISAVLAIFMLTSAEPTVTPAASTSSTPTAVVVGTITVGGPTTTPIPSPQVPNDTFVPGHLVFTKGSVIYRVHGYDQPVPLARGREPALSTNGRHLAYVLFYKNYQDLYTLDLTTGRGFKLLDDNLTDPNDASTGTTAAAPAWSNDASSVYFSWSYPGAPIPNTANFNRTDLSVSRCAASGPCNQGVATKLTTPNFQTGGDFEPAPRPLDADTLVYTKYQYQPDQANNYRSLGQLHALTLSTGGDVSLTSDQDSDSQPVWSPNGRYLLFVKLSADDQHTSIYAMPFHAPGNASDYARARLLVRGNPFAADPALSPDGRYLAYVATGDDGRNHVYIGRAHLGAHGFVEHVQLLRRAGIVDGDRLAWGP